MHSHLHLHTCSRTHNAVRHPRLLTKTAPAILAIVLWASSPSWGEASGNAMAQTLDSTYHSAMWLTTTPGTLVSFGYEDEGEEYVISWGMDTAWDVKANVVRGTNHIGKEYISTGRVSFQPTDTVDADGNLAEGRLYDLKNRCDHILLSGTTEVMLNCDHYDEQMVEDNYKGHLDRWMALYKATMEYVESRGLKVVSIAPFNEPDNKGYQGDMDDFRELSRMITEDSFFEGVRISAGNVMDDDLASEWYNYMKPYVTEGNSHQLAGSFDAYADFYQEVRADGNYAMQDELHNVGDAIVAVEYGLQAGIWWTFDGKARGRFCQANSEGGARLGYGENRDNWTSAAVYRLPDGKVEAFLGGCEWQALTTTFAFASTDREIYCDGYGPVRAYAMELPGGTGYINGQTNAERLIQIWSGEDVPSGPVEAGTYVIMNKKSKKVLAPSSGSTSSWSTVTQQSYSPASPKTYRQWRVEPVDPRVGGDFSYYSIACADNTAMYLDVQDWSLEEGGGIITYAGGMTEIEQWYLEYAGDGDYYIRSRYTNLLLQPADGSTNSGAAIQQAELTGEDEQRWRLLPVDATCELVAPAAPTGLNAIAQPASVALSWNANEEDDMEAYIVLRGTQEEDGSIDWQVIGQHVKATAFVDNSCRQDAPYLYKVRAVDYSGNRSDASDSICAQTSGEQALVAHYEFDDGFLDLSENHFNAAYAGDTTFSTHLLKSGTASISLDGEENFVQLPPQVGDQRQMSVAAWAYIPSSNDDGQRIFDFGNGPAQCVYLTPCNGSTMQLVFRNGDEEQTLSATKLRSGWHHLCATLSDSLVCLYMDGELAASTADITLRPADFHPALCFLGRAQDPDEPLLKGRLDDLRVYNYALSAQQVQAVMDDLSTDIAIVETGEGDAAVVRCEYYATNGMRLTGPTANAIVIMRRWYANGTCEVKKIFTGAR